MTITYRGENPEKLSYLLHKHPNRPQVFNVSANIRSYVFYPELNENTCTVALLLDIDSLELAKSDLGKNYGNLFDYINDRPYVCSSFVCVAMNKIFKTAMSGKCSEFPELVDKPIDLEIRIAGFPCRCKTEMIEKIFGPLGYSTEFEQNVLSEEFPEWGNNPNISLCLKANKTLKEVLMHLYVLIPVFDNKKHYYVGEDEVNKLIKNSEEWLKEHPHRDFILKRYFRFHKGLYDAASEQLDVTDSEELSEENPEEVSVPNLNTMRINYVVEALKKFGAKKILDLACGEGNITKRLFKDEAFDLIGASDVSPFALAKLKRKLKLKSVPEEEKEKLNIFQSSLLYYDERFKEYESCIVVEAIEHLDPNQLEIFEKNIFGSYDFENIIITTPNFDFNKNFETLESKYRHKDHRFELSNNEFNNWVMKITIQYPYSAVINGIGNPDEEGTFPTHAVVFKRDSREEH